MGGKYRLLAVIAESPSAAIPLASLIVIKTPVLQFVPGPESLSRLDQQKERGLVFTQLG
jgi:hypothetical protein